MKEGLSPIIDKNTEILILGSLPSDESILQQKYYAKPSNDFWKLLSEVLEADLVKIPYEDKINALKNNKIGLWDVFKHAKREGSLDVNISDEELNNFIELKNKFPNIRLICLNGKKAGENKQIFTNLGFNTLLLPSSSGANRRNNEKRILEWKKIKIFIKN